MKVSAYVPRPAPPPHLFFNNDDDEAESKRQSQSVEVDRQGEGSVNGDHVATAGAIFLIAFSLFALAMVINYARR